MFRTNGSWIRSANAVPALPRIPASPTKPLELFKEKISYTGSYILDPSNKISILMVTLAKRLKYSNDLKQCWFSDGLFLPPSLHLFLSLSFIS